MKNIFLFLALLPLFGFAQNTVEPGTLGKSSYVKSVSTLTTDGAFELTKHAFEAAAALDKKVSVAVLDADGVIILLVRGENVGPHNTEASRRQAFTALSTKNASFTLMQNATADPTAQNLNTLPELLLSGGGVPVWQDGQVIGSIGVSGAGGGLQDHNVAKQAVEKLGFSITNSVLNQTK